MPTTTVNPSTTASPSTTANPTTTTTTTCKPNTFKNDGLKFYVCKNGKWVLIEGCEDLIKALDELNKKYNTEKNKENDISAELVAITEKAVNEAKGYAQRSPYKRVPVILDYWKDQINQKTNELKEATKKVNATFKEIENMESRLRECLVSSASGQTDPNSDQRSYNSNGRYYYYKEPDLSAKLFNAANKLLSGSYDTEINTNVKYSR